MSILTWNDQFNVGLPSVDQQHRRLVDIINQLDEAVAIGDEAQTVLDLIAALIDYTHYHFSHEEQLMAQAGYDQQYFAKHKQQHKQFVNLVLQEQAKAKLHPESVSDQLLSFLVGWLSEHILVSDKQMALALGQKGLASEEALRIDQSDIIHSHLYLALRESETRFKQLADHLPALIWLSNKQQQLVFCNQFCLKLFALERGALNKHHWLQAIDQRDRKNVEDIHNQVASQHNSQQLEYRIISQGEQIIWVLETVMPRIGKNGQFIGLMACAMDISLQKLTEEDLEQKIHHRTEELVLANQTLAYEKSQQIQLNQQLKQMQSHLIQSEKMASIGQLAAGVAHEINNPLAYISSNLNTLQQYFQELLQAADLAEQLAKVVASDHPLAIAYHNFQDQADLAFIKNDIVDLLSGSSEGALRAKKIVQDLLNFSGIHNQQLSLYQLEASIDATLNIMSSDIIKKAKIVKYYAGIKPFNCVSGQINQVIMNLLINALQAIPEFGTITIRTGYKNTDYLWFEIEDNGQGIAQDIQSKIFDPFFTTKPVGKGTGLGLSLSYKIIKDHHGSIILHSEVGQGTKFRVFLPTHCATNDSGKSI